MPQPDARAVLRSALDRWTDDIDIEEADVRRQTPSEYDPRGVAEWFFGEFVPAARAVLDGG